MIGDDQIPAIVPQVPQATTIKSHRTGRSHELPVDADPVFSDRHQDASNRFAYFRDRQQQLDDRQDEDWYEPEYGVDREDGEIGHATQVTDK